MPRTNHYYHPEDSVPESTHTIARVFYPPADAYGVIGKNDGMYVPTLDLQWGCGLPAGGSNTGYYHLLSPGDTFDLQTWLPNIVAPGADFFTDGIADWFAKLEVVALDGTLLEDNIGHIAENRWLMQYAPPGGLPQSVQVLRLSANTLLALADCFYFRITVKSDTAPGVVAFYSQPFRKIGCQKTVALRWRYPELDNFGHLYPVFGGPRHYEPLLRLPGRMALAGYGETETSINGRKVKAA